MCTDGLSIILMMDGAKIHFSTAEAELMNNANIILTKIGVQEKVRLLLVEAQALMLLLKSPHAAFSTAPKISKGENYLGLPYTVLDYPRHFSGTETILIRSMFWWGRYFSSTLLLAGSPKDQFLANIKKSYEGLKGAGYFIGINPDPWQHHFEQDNYCAVANLSYEAFAMQCDRFDHIKIATNWPLDQPYGAPVRWVENWYVLVKMLGLVAAQPVE
jgi:hypothetical protein